MTDIPAGDSNWLWVRSRGHCAYPACEGVLVQRDGEKWVTQGERAHIRSDTPEGPRYEADYSDPNRFENLLLMCRPHHRLIDAQPERYPVELLEQWKVEHEGPVFAAHPVLTGPPPTGARYRRTASLFERLQSTLSSMYGVALVGLSGVGKTQLVTDYFSESVDQFTLRIWIRADDPEVAREDYSRIGAYVGAPRRPDESVGDHCDRVRAALESTNGWLLVFDDAPNEAAVDRLVPRTGGRVVVTSQSQAWSILGILEVEPLSRAMSIELLRSHPEFATAEDDLCNRVAETSGDLPLCLVQLLGYLDATAMPVERLVALYESRRIELLSRGAPPDHVPMQIAVTRSIEALSTEALVLLRSLAFLSPSPFPMGAVQDGLAAGGALLGASFDALALEDAVADLRRFSLVNRQRDYVTVHSIIQSLVREALSPEATGTSIVLAIELVFAVLPSRVDRPEHAPYALDVLPHANAIVAVLQHIPDSGSMAARFINRLAPTYRFEGDGATERRELERALSLLDSDPVDDPALRGSILNNLANCCADAGDFVSAIEMTRQALRCKIDGGDDDASIALTKGSLACHLEQVGELAEALDLHRQALALLEPLGYRRGIADSLVDQGRVLYSQRDIDGAQACCERALIEAGDHPDAWAERVEANLRLANIYEHHDLTAARAFAESAVESALVCAVPSSALGRALGTRGRYVVQLGNLPKGISDLQAAAEVFNTCEGPGQNYAQTVGMVGHAQVQLGLAARDMSVAAGGLAKLRESLELLHQFLPADHPSIIIAESMLRSATQIVWG